MPNFKTQIGMQLIEQNRRMLEAELRDHPQALRVQAALNKLESQAPPPRLIADVLGEM